MWRFAYALLAVIAFGVSGCSGDEPHAGANPEKESPSAASQHLLIEWIAAGNGDPYRCALLAGAEKAARALNVELVIHRAAQMTWFEQGKLLSDAIARNARAVVLDPVAYTHLVGVLRAAHDRGTRVVLVNVPPDDNPGYVWSFVAPGGRGRSAALGFQVGQAAISDAVAAAFSRPVPFRTIEMDPGQTPDDSIIGKCEAEPNLWIRED